MSANPHGSPGKEGIFATTQWTRVLAARGESAEARAALSELCQAYYEPVVVFLRSRVGQEDRARDLAHAFFERVLEKGGMTQVNPDRGRFRSYLLGAVKHFLSDLRDREVARKRGGAVEHVALGPGTGTSPGVDAPDPSAELVDGAFDRQWAFTLLDRSLERLAREHSDAGKAEQFEVLQGWLTGTGDETRRAEACARLGLNEGAFKVAVHRLRKRFREVIRSEIAQTVHDLAEVDAEMRYLLEVVSR